jgi:hypothetical protein
MFIFNFYDVTILYCSTKEVPVPVPAKSGLQMLEVAKPNDFNVFFSFFDVILQMILIYLPSLSVKLSKSKFKIHCSSIPVCCHKKKTTIVYRING